MGDLARLPDLARKINAEHAACVALACDAILKAIEVGRLLSEAKALVKHGEWEPWIETNCRFGVRQAQKYMRAFENREALETQMRTRSAHLTSLNGAIECLADHREADCRIDNESPVKPRGRLIPAVCMTDGSIKFGSFEDVRIDSGLPPGVEIVIRRDKYGEIYIPDHILLLLSQSGTPEPSA
jgi:Protein of unknown function (DUF3102)